MLSKNPIKTCVSNVNCLTVMLSRCSRHSKLPHIFLAMVQVTGTDYVDRGDTIQLVCNASGDPYPPNDVTWYKDSVKLNPDAQNGLLITKRINNRVLISNLVIRHSRMEDGGDYVCVASDGGSGIAGMMTVHVLYGECQMGCIMRKGP